MLNHAEQQRIEVAGATPRQHKSLMGQFMTPASVAAFMAGLFAPTEADVRLLDAGAGLGALTCAVLERLLHQGRAGSSIAVEAYELDPRLRAHLEKTLLAYEDQGVRAHVRAGDYLEQAAEEIEQGVQRFTHAILNPPYKKINTHSEARRQARRGGLETVNLYSAFVGLALAQLEQGGQLVAIIPRSFCNGPYYKPFRDFIFRQAALKHIHLFDSRTEAFRDDEVLQENVIILLEKGSQQTRVCVSHSRDDTFTDNREESYGFEEIVRPGDVEAFIHIPQTTLDRLDASPFIRSTLEDLGISVSTGPVVDFRTRPFLRDKPDSTTVPLLYAQHFEGRHTVWPVDGKKPNAIVAAPEIERWLYPGGTYVAVRRFSSKEERRRVVASVVDPTALGNPTRIGFENHLNVYHAKKRGLPSSLAWGLFVYLNSSVVDEHLRRFSGHTQVNATDLKNIRYPARMELESLGEWAKKQTELSQHIVDQRMEALLEPAAY